jgi:hypothetical protein
MATCPTLEAVYEEEIETITLRDTDGINIPKSVREVAFVLAVDIVIVSTAREVYKNYSTTPSEGFYGNATLVMQDCLERKIPINMPRQRIYYGRVPEAFVNWQALVDWSYFQWYMTTLGVSLASLGEALGAGTIPPSGCCAPPDRGWVELPLREVYFNCPKGTQYKIETSWWKAASIVDGCGKTRDGKSKQKDGDKDKGLPPNGTQPKTAPNPNDPFAGNRPPTSDRDQGDWSNSKGEDKTNNPSPLERPDPSNSTDRPATPTSEGFYLKWNVEFFSGVDGSGVYGTAYTGCLADSTFDVGSIPQDTPIFDTPCGKKDVVRYRVRITLTSFDMELITKPSFSFAGQVLFGLLPENDIKSKNLYCD